MEIEIYVICSDCEGCGETEDTIGGWTAAGPWQEYRINRCHHCEGSGENMFILTEYDSIEEARQEHPTERLEAVRCGIV